MRARVRVKVKREVLVKADVRRVLPTKTQELDKPNSATECTNIDAFSSPSNSNSSHMSKSHPLIQSRARAQCTDTRADCTHAQGSRDSTAALITPNGSIRRTVMINPVEPLPLHSVTCRAAAPPPALPVLTDRRSTWWPADLHKVT